MATLEGASVSELFSYSVFLVAYDSKADHLIGQLLY